jgi:NSS family neurotransmitter:Na+ symporter
MWRFSYLASESGGAAFVVLYIALTVFLGLPIMLAEFAIGRGARKSPIEALAHFGGPRWRPLGLLFVASGFLIASYYSVVAGWTLRYSLETLIWGPPADSGAHFGGAINNGWAVMWHVIFMLITVGTVLSGVRAGIERVAMILMPLLAVVVVGLAVYAATLDGAGAGYRYYLELDLDSLLQPDVLNQAASQAFFSLSLGMGAMMTYASYLPDDSHLPEESLVVGFSDFGVAFVAGLAVFPMIFAFGLSEQVSESNVGALFITLPTAFAEMGATGRVVGVLFFTALAIGALTSLISLLEVVVSATMDGLGWSRRVASLVIGGIVTALGIAPALNDGHLDIMDRYAGNLFLVLGAFCLSLFVGWVWKRPLEEVSKGAETVGWFGAWLWLMRIPVPLILLWVLYGFARSQLLGD